MEQRFMAYENKLTKVKLLQSLDSTECLTLMIDGEKVYHSMRLPNYPLMELLQKDQGLSGQCMFMEYSFSNNSICKIICGQDAISFAELLCQL